MADSFALASGDDQARDFSSPGLDGNRQSATNAANTAVEGKFSDEEAVGYFLLAETTVSADDAEGHGQIEPGLLS